jgi:hypothetical protein
MQVCPHVAADSMPAVAKITGTSAPHLGYWPPLMLAFFLLSKGGETRYGVAPFPIAVGNSDRFEGCFVFCGTENSDARL